MAESEKLLKLLKDIADITEKHGNVFEKNDKNKVIRQREESICDFPVINRYFPMRKNIIENSDRVIPISTTTLNEYNRKTDSDIKNVELHYGPNSDELTRSYHANALTIGAAIYLNTKAYKPETEEGQKTLVHELTHIKQNQEDILEGQKSVEDLESEAEQMEKIAEYNPEVYKTITVKGKEYKVTQKLYNEMIKKVKFNVEHWIADLDKKIPDEEYLELLLKYEKLENEKKFIWQQK